MRAENPDQLIFHQATDTFSLTAALNGNKLTVALKDFVDWIVYEKEYTEEDYCKEIHKKMDLNDVYVAFSQTKLNCEYEVTKLKHYELGSVIEYEGNPCYKIETGGNVTVYFGMVDKKTKKEVTCESKLQLTKVRNMAKMEIISEKANIQKKSVFGEDELNKKIQKMMEGIISLQEPNACLQQQVEMLKQEQQDKNHRFQRFQQKIIQINHQKQQLHQKTQHLLVQSKRSSDKFSEIDKILQIIRPTLVYTALPQTHSTCFKVDGLKVQYTRQDSKWTHYFFNQPIFHNQSAKFKLKVTKAHSKSILIGVVDYAKQKNQQQSSESGNAMCYFSFNGRKFPQGDWEGDGFDEGDVVEVDVNRATKTIKYWVNGLLKATHSSQILDDSQRIFMPFVEMYRNNDAVEWLME